MWIETARSLFRLTGAEVAAWERRLVDYPEDDIRKMMDEVFAGSKDFDDAGKRLNRMEEGLRQIIRERLAEEAGRSRKPEKRTKRPRREVVAAYRKLRHQAYNRSISKVDWAKEWNALNKKFGITPNKSSQDYADNVIKTGEKWILDKNKQSMEHKEDDRDEFYKEIIAEKEA